MTMKIQVAVVVYTRWKNAERWRRVWAAQPRDEAFVLIQNRDGINVVTAEQLEDGRLVIDRPNIGLDIGALQDSVRNRLPIPNDWDWLFWTPDDFLPMAVDFLEPYRRAIQNPNVALVVSRLTSGTGIAEHCRTGAFMIRRDAAERLSFPADPMTTVNQCHDFEFRSHNMLAQVRGMGFEATTLSPDDKRIVWDSHVGQGQLTDEDRCEDRLSEFPCLDLGDIFELHGTDKGTLHSYGPVYESLLSAQRDDPRPVLELGVQYGQSLRAWREYFTAATIHGIDCNAAAMIRGDARITTHLVNIREALKLTRLARTHGPFQLIVDDISHNPDDVLPALATLWPFVADGGLYVIEDVQTPALLDMFSGWPGAVVFDRRSVNGRSDDMLCAIRKPST